MKCKMRGNHFSCYLPTFISGPPSSVICFWCKCPLLVDLNSPLGSQALDLIPVSSLLETDSLFFFQRLPTLRLHEFSWHQYPLVQPPASPAKTVNSVRRILRCPLSFCLTRSLLFFISLFIFLPGSPLTARIILLMILFSIPQHGFCFEKTWESHHYSSFGGILILLLCSSSSQSRATVIR